MNTDIDNYTGTLHHKSKATPTSSIPKAEDRNETASSTEVNQGFRLQLSGVVDDDLQSRGWRDWHRPGFDLDARI